MTCMRERRLILAEIYDVPWAKGGRKGYAVHEEDEAWDEDATANEAYYDEAEGWI